MNTPPSPSSVDGKTDIVWPYPGARWWKFDFHTHTPASADYGKGPQQAELRKISPRDWLLGYMGAGVDCVAVTDHNTGDWIDKLKEQLCALETERPAGFRPLTLFPGVEITANGGIHVLAVLGLNKDSADVAALLQAAGYEGQRGASDSAAKGSPIEVVEAICNAGGVPILAHVDGPAGAWKMSGNSLGPLLDTEGLFALEVVDPSGEKPQLYKDRKLNWAEIIGSDAHHPTGNPRSDSSRYPGARYTWVKMATPSLEGLRLALLDGGDFSLRRSDDKEFFDPFAVPKNFIEAIEIEDARYMGCANIVRVEFSPWLNAMVGGRGTGKSTVLHTLRLAAARQEELSDLEERNGPSFTFREFDRVPRNRQDRGGLRENTMIRWLVRREDVRYRVHWQHHRTFVEYCDDHDWKTSPSHSVTPQRFPLRLFSQGQIAELAGENQALLRVVDAAAQVEAQRRRLEEARTSFNALRARIREIEQRLHREDALLIESQDVESKLKRFEDAGHESVLKNYRQRERQRHTANRQLDSASAAADRVDRTAGELELDDIPSGVFGVGAEDQQAESILSSISVAVQATAARLREEAARLQHVVAEQRQRLNQSRWQMAVNNATSSYRALVQDLDEAGVKDPGEYDKLIQSRALLEQERERLGSWRDERNRLIRESNEQRSVALEARREMSAARRHFLSETLAYNRFVRMSVRAYGFDSKVVERSLRKQLDITDDRFQEDILSEDGQTGIVADLLADLPEENEQQRSAELEDRISLFKERIERACGGSVEFRGRFNNYFEREFNNQPELLDKMLNWYPEDELMVEYSPHGDGKDFRPIQQASAGQRSAAMLAFLLAHGDEPLVLDQPEDDLDNHLIYDLVVRQIRENKLRRQIIVVTHNANIVVNGDAELVHAFRFDNGQCFVSQFGSLQDAEIREEVCQIMEGGREAFVRRYRRLGREPRNV